ncbi:hypothetical protein V7149_20690 [Bacillus sp. JJ1503]|uniref:hypothetical protein n=1 Tax=Bacillus sp. JJ1503 TaxID=3122956 RepID=UPI002FFD614F
MNKKKAIKVLSATAIAASAFVATAPAGTEAAASDVQTLVKKAKDAGTVLKWAISTEGSADGKTRPYAQYNAAKAARDAAVKAINKLPAAQKAGYLADIEQNVTLHINRTMAYIDAITAGEKITVKKQALEAQIEQNLIDGKTEAAYHALSTEIRKQAILLDRVYGKSTRDAIRAQYKKSAETVRDSVKFEVSVKIELDLAKQALAANNTVDVEKHLAEAAKYMKDVKNEAMKTTLTNTLEEVEGQLVPTVKSVSAISATQVEVKFSKAVDAASLFADGKSGAFKSTATVTINSIDGVAAGTLSGKLSADGKTLTVTTQNPVSKRYNVVVDGLSTKDAKAVTKFDEVVSFVADTTAPTILGTERISAGQVKVKFSEPMKAFATVAFKYADGSAVTGVSGQIEAGASEAVFTMTDNVTSNKEVVATFIGAQDQAGNLITPNPATVSFVKGAADGIAPTVSSITQTGANTFAVKFSEALLVKPVIVVGATTVDTAKVVQDTNDSTVYNVTAPAVLEGATTVQVKSFTDLSGEAGTDVSRVVTFVKETAAPKVLSSNVVVDSTDKKEYLEITFDKDVTLGSTPTVDVTSGSYVKDFVTTTINNSGITPKAVDYKTSTNKKVIRVALSSLLTGKDVKGATYSLNLAFANVNSASNVAAETTTATFTRGEDGVPTSTAKVGVTSVAQDSNDNSKLNVTFNKAVDGASATLTSNYKIDGAVVESVTLMPAVTSGDTVTQVAVLNLKANSNAFTGTRNITISNVKALGSTVAMDQYFVNNVSIKENVAPTVTSAKLTATDEITLTFSEAVKQAGTTNKDFELLVGGQSIALAQTYDAGLTSTAATTVKVKITAVSAEAIAKGLSLKGLSTIDVKDEAGNVLSVPANIVVSN